VSNEARDWAWSLPNLPTPARLLLLALAEHVREGATTCFPGQARLAALCSVSDRQVRNLLRELQARGLISVEHRAGQGDGRRSNRYRLAMGGRKPDSDCPERNPEAGFRNGGSGCAPASGNPVPGNRNSGAGNRNGASDEPEEGIVRRKERDTPPYPPKGGDLDHSGEDFSPSAQTASEGTPAQQGSRPVRAGQQGGGSRPRRGTGTRRGKRDEAHERLAEKDYTVGATRDEDLPDWARAWRDRVNDPQ
jgi:hypothetical protein